MEELHHPIYDSQESHVICTLVVHESSHYGAIYSYIHDGIIPKTFNQSKRKTLFKMPLAIPLSLVICIGGV